MRGGDVVHPTPGWRKASVGIFFFLKISYLFIHERHRDREREAETQAEGEAGSIQGA